MEVEGNGVIAVIKDGTIQHSVTSGLPAADEWVFWRVQFDRTGALQLFHDGVMVPPIQITDVQGVDTPSDMLCFGGPTNREYSGVLDEVRIYKGVQTPQWISVEYANVHDREAFMTIGDEVAR